MLNKRCQKILKYLLSEEQPVSVETLGKVFSVGGRSIQSDIKCIKDWLAANKLPPVLVKYGKGISVIGQREEILACLNAESGNSCELSVQDRLYAIAGHLLFWGSTSTNSIAAMLDTSSSTTTKDMRAVKKWMIRQNVNIVSRPHHGTFILDQEANIRRGCFALLKELLNESDYTPKSLILSEFSEVENLLHGCRLDSVSIEVHALRGDVMALVKQIQAEFQFHLTDNGFCDIFFYMLIATIRLRAGHPIDTDAPAFPFFTQLLDAQTQLAGAWNEHLKQKQLESRELVWQLLCWYSVDRYALSEKQIVLDRCVSEEFFRSVQFAQGHSIIRTRELKTDLNTQLERFFCRQLLRQNDQQGDEVSTEIYSDEYYPIVCEALQELAARYLDEAFRMDESIVATILSILKYHLWSEEHNVLKRIVVIHDGTVSDAYELRLKLRKVFSLVGSLHTISYNEFLARGYPKCDILLSTVPLPLDENQYCRISASLQVNDIIQLTGNLPLRVRGMDERLIVDTMMNTRSIQPQQKLMLLVEIARVLQRDVSQHSGSPHLSNLLQPSLIRTRLKVRDGDEAIQMAGNLLIQRGFIKQSHVNEMLYFNKEYNGYSVIDDGVAMPHLMTSDVSSPCISLVTLQKPVAMRSGGNRLVSLVIMLVTNNDRTHLSIIEELVALLDDSERKQRLLNARSIEEVRQIINMSR